MQRIAHGRGVGKYDRKASVALAYDVDNICLGQNHIPRRTESIQGNNGRLLMRVARKTLIVILADTYDNPFCPNWRATLQVADP